VIFVDTSFFVALMDPATRTTAAPLRLFQSFQDQRLNQVLLTTNNVVLEAITVTRYEVGHALALTTGGTLYSEKLTRIHRTTAEEEAAAFEYLKQHSDKEYSAVDCLSFVVMLKLGINGALAFDEDFGHRFVVRPGPA
jgi:predicted nucleic acid-binding protein